MASKPATELAIEQSDIAKTDEPKAQPRLSDARISLVAEWLISTEFPLPGENNKDGGQREI